MKKNPTKSLLTLTGILLLVAMILGVPATSAAGDIVINEALLSHTGTDDTEFLEFFGTPGASLDGLSLIVVESDAGTSLGSIDRQLDFGPSNTLGANGFFLVGNPAGLASNYGVTPDWDIANNFFENSSLTLALVETASISGSAVSGSEVVLDTVAANDGGAGDTFFFGAPVIGPDGSFFPAGVRRVVDGVDTDTAADWVLSDFNLGADNTPTPAGDVKPPIGACGDPATLIHVIQGNGLVSPEVGNTHIIEGVVVGDFQGSTGLNGFMVQEENSDVDANPLTSEGIFVFDPANAVALEAGDVVRVQGSVAEFFTLTRLENIAAVIDCNTTDTASPSTVTLPVKSVDDFEPFEGMAVTFTQTLYASGNFNQGRYGEVDLSINGPLDNPTNVAEPGAAANAVRDLNNLSRIQLDDGSDIQNPLPLPPYIGDGGTLRTGDSIVGLSAVMNYSFGVYELHPTGPVTFTRNNVREGVPDVGGSIQVAAYNVLNYFTTIDDSGPICGPNGDQGCRGADSVFEFDRQKAKLVDAISQLDADIVGLMEIENYPGDVPIADLVDGINAVAGAGAYNYIATGAIGTDAIRVGILYKPVSVTPLGNFAILDSSKDPAFDDTLNRPVLAQTFSENGTDDVVTVAVNHLKSKGSACPGDPDIGDGQGNCNLTRTAAAQALVDWLDTDPTGHGNGQYIINGDLNAYAMEDPVTTIEAGGYTDLIEKFAGNGWADSAYSYNFFSESGYLDHGLSSPALLPRVTGASFWHVNADEPSALDYNSYNQPALFNPDEFRSSDHDPVVVGICETTAPVVTATASPDKLWPPNHKYVEVSVTVDVTDADDNPTVTLLSVTSNEPDNGLGDGDTPDDIVIIDDFTFDLRAERSGTGDGRIYTITYEVTDACGNSTVTSAEVTVPKDKGQRGE